MTCKVSVSMITYNHEKFIAQAIESVLMQQVNFDYEIVIGEDDSSDRTREIVIEYYKKHPEKIRLLLNDRKNVIYIDGRPTGRWNFINTIKHAQGQYVALLDGDDYWTSPYKLQKQVDFLEDHPECAICFHGAKELFEDGRKSKLHIPPIRREIYHLKDLLEWDFIPAPSTMFRNRLFDDFPDWFRKTPMGDWPLHILNAHHGTIGYIDEVMSVHRVHSGGIWSARGQEHFAQRKIEFYKILSAHLNPCYDRVIKAGIFFWRYRSEMIKGKRRDAFINLLKCLVRSPFHFAFLKRGPHKIALELLSPGLYRNLKTWKQRLAS